MNFKTLIKSTSSIIFLYLVFGIQLASGTFVDKKLGVMEIEDSGVFYVYGLETPPLDDRNLKKLKNYNEILAKKKNDKDRATIQKRIDSIYQTWEKKSPKTALVQFYNPDHKISSLRPIELITKKSHKLELGKYYEGKLIRKRDSHPSQMTVYHIEIYKNSKGKLISAKECEKPNWWDTVHSGVAKWMPNEDTKEAIKVVSFEYSGFARRYNSYWAEYTIEYKNTGTKTIKLATVVVYLVDQDGTVWTGTAHGKPHFKNWKTGETRRNKIFVSDDDLDNMTHTDPRVLQLVVD